ncbi:uncharacterized protein PFL1_05925 [Pseudozyma flocculosa PF-1]|uniref:Mitochondrial distribution and morphology protein 12 n=1 Tax=Pseudozyma flocculosa PF-1 TaxID=1277687 RepID=A0A061H2W2_9BASI|nr:uncharacterized protein PFL1_05925 [Pseudozyma flocculosa PF-1]EPQ26604.1 hypothetical protein PFL1_05925 [Pseudozyma flocculosa PF-1]
MSLDLDWTLLDSELSTRLLSTLNRALESGGSKRPSFLGDIAITSLEFGAHPPDVSIRHVGDVWTDFVTHDDVPAIAAVPEHPLGNAAQARTRRTTPDTFDAPSRPSVSPESIMHDQPYGPGPELASPGTLPFRTYTQFNDAQPPHRVQGPPSVFSGSMAASTPGSVLPSPYLPHHHSQQQQWSAALASRGIRAAGSVASGPGPQQPSGPNSPDALPASIPPQSPGYFGHWQNAAGAGAGAGATAASSRKTSYDAATTSSSFLGRGVGPSSSISNVLPRPPTRSERGRFPAAAAGGAPHHHQYHPASHRPHLRSGQTTTSSFRTHSGGGGPTSPPPYLGGPSAAHLRQDTDAQDGAATTTTTTTTMPSMQLHFSLNWPTTTFRLTIQTSLLINYPSPAFMSLPLQLSVTGFVMRCGLILSIEGEKRRVHVCLLEPDEEEEEEQGDEGDGVVDEMVPGDGGAGWRRRTTYTVPRPVIPAAGAGAGAGAGIKTTPPSAGTRILPSLSFESEVGQPDKHALKNVGKVEKFIAEVLRKAIEDELVFPNYYTIDLPPP